MQGHCLCCVLWQQEEKWQQNLTHKNAMATLLPAVLLYLTLIADWVDIRWLAQQSKDFLSSLIAVFHILDFPLL